MGLIRMAISRPMTTLMIFVILIVMGYRSYTLLQIDSFPKIDFPVVSVVVVFPNASPQDVSDLVVEPIEEAVASISGIDAITSSANEGVGQIVIAFKDGVDGNEAAIEIERRVSSIGGQLPADANDPSIVKADIGAVPIMNLVLRGPQTQDALFEFADEFLVDRFQAVSGVASVNVAGGRTRQIQVNVDMERLSAYKLTLGAIERAIRDSNETFPVGTIEQGRQKSTIRSVGDFTSLAEIENVVLPTPPGGGQVYLRNVATVQESYADLSQIIRYNGSEAVNVSITKTSDGNTVDVADSLYAIIDDVQADLPAEAELILVTDSSSDIRASVNGVQEDLVLAILITGIVMLVFLHRVPTTLIVLFAIPTSLIATLIVMWALGFTLNQITLMAMTLIIGNLVDDSIVVLENTEYHIGLGKSAVQASIDARQEILLPSLVIASTDLVVYLPVAFMSGVAGQVFFPYGVTIASATVVSLFVGFTLTPMLASKWMKADNDAPTRRPTGLLWLFGLILTPISWLWSLFTRAWNVTFNLLANFYAGIIRFALANFFTQLLVILIGIGSFAAGIYLVVGGVVGTEFFPVTDDGQFRIEVEMPPGTNLEATDQIVRQIELIVLDAVPETTALLSNVGRRGGGGLPGGGSTGASNQATVNVRLVDTSERERSNTDIVNAMRPLLANLPEAIITVGLNANGPGGSSPVSLNVYGPDADTLIELAHQVEAVMTTVEGVVDIKNTGASRTPETEFIIDRELAIDQGLTPSDVANALRTALTGKTVGDFKTSDGTDTDIRLRLDETSRQDFTKILQLPLSYSNGQPIRVDRFAALEETQAPATISRTDRRQTLQVTSGVLGRAAGDVIDDVEAAVQERVVFPVGYGFELSGSSESQRKIFAEFGQAIVLAILLVYVLMVALYQNWLQPLAIMISLPVAIVGSFGFLALTGNTLNILSLLGIILLIGIITKNAILLVDFANQAREEGMDRKEALIEAGRRRLRAILMTSLTLIFALLPMLLAVGAGAGNRQPLAAVVMGGAISSNLLTLILIPVVYVWFDAGGGGLSRAVRWVIGLKQDDDAESTPKGVQPAPQPTSSITTNPDVA